MISSKTAGDGFENVLNFFVLPQQCSVAQRRLQLQHGSWLEFSTLVSSRFLFLLSHFCLFFIPMVKVQGMTAGKTNRTNQKMNLKVSP